MKYNIKVFLNRIPENYKILQDFERARLYHLKHGIDIRFTFFNTDIGGYYSYYESGLNRWLIKGAHELLDIDPKADSNLFVFDQAEWSNLPGAQFPLKTNTPNGSCAPLWNDSNIKPFICVGAYVVDHEDGQLWIQIAHEIMHSLTQNANLKGISVKDVMDTYYHNDDPDYPSGNFAQQWFLLQSFIFTPKDKFIFTKDLFYGMNGEDVVQLQKRLATYAFFNAEYSTHFGSKTLEAVKDFQRIKGLVVDGAVGPKTRGLLNN